jgi:hypothetical protein
VLGIGDQTYVFAGSQLDATRNGFGKPSLGMIGGGLFVPLSSSGTTLCGEVLVARTQPDPIAGAPPTVGLYKRAEISLNQPLARTRLTSLDARLSLDLVSQTLAAPQFAIMLNADRYAAGRIGLTWHTQAGRTQAGAVPPPFCLPPAPGPAIILPACR